jgi:hypothetical protein
MPLELNYATLILVFHLRGLRVIVPAGLTDAGAVR